MHNAHTAQWAGLKGKKNGELLRAAEAAGYDGFLTVDQGIPHEQRSLRRRLSIILMRSRTNQMSDLLLLVDLILQTLATIQAGQIVTVPPPA